MRRRFRWYARRRWLSERERTRACFYQQPVGVAVVATFKLDNLRASCKTPRYADGTHRRLSARTDQSHHLHRRHQLDKQTSHLKLGLGWRAKRQPALGHLLHGFDDLWMRMARNHWPPRPDVIDVNIAVDIPNLCAAPALDEGRRAAHRAVRAHRRIYAAGN